MHWPTRLKRRFLVSAPVSFLIRRSKKIYLPGFQGLPLFDVARFFFKQAGKIGFTERASAISFNFTMTIPPAVIFLFTLIPYLPISQQFINQLFDLIRDVMPGEKNNGVLIKFLAFPAFIGAVVAARLLVLSAARRGRSGARQLLVLQCLLLAAFMLSGWRARE